jgi:uncharacterized membrane protein YtjA (UPF0391 family)
MRTSTIVFLVIAIIAGALTFSGLSESVANIAKGVYFVFMLLVAASVLLEPEDLESIRRPLARTEPLRPAPFEASRASLPVAAPTRPGIDVR